MKSFERLTPCIGAEISDVDLRKVTQDDVDYIKDVLLDAGVVFFRDQNLTPEQHIALGRRFGHLESHPYLPNEDDYPEIMRIKTDSQMSAIEREHYDKMWHTDITCDERPPMGAILLLREIPANGGGDTLWCNTAAAYEALSDEMKSFLCRLTAIHSTPYAFQDERAGGKQGQKAPETAHPVIRTHPETGRNAIYVNSTFTKKIVELEAIESDALLKMLYRHMESPQFHCRFKWRPGSVAFWDNRFTQHRPLGDYAGYSRYGQRVTLAGEKPYFETPSTTVTREPEPAL